nr:hypothetical protein [Desulfobacula sp.]
MTQLFLNFVIAAVATFFLSRFIVPFCFKNLPIPVHIFPTIHILLIISIFLSSFWFLHHLVVINEKEETPLDAKREAARILALEALRQGTSLSVAVSKLPKQTKVYQAAKELLNNSTRYQEQVAAAEKALNSTNEIMDKSLRDYLNKVAELGRYKPAYVSYAIDLIGNGDLTHRERIVVDLLNNHVNSFRNDTQVDIRFWLTDFTKHFTNFVD